MIFLAIWGEGYERLGEEAKVERVPLSFFSEDNGYSAVEAAHLVNLDVGEAHTEYQHGYHTIVRIA